MKKAGVTSSVICRLEDIVTALGTVPGANNIPVRLSKGWHKQIQNLYNVNIPTIEKVEEATAPAPKAAATAPAKAKH